MAINHTWYYQIVLQKQYYKNSTMEILLTNKSLELKRTT